MVKQVVRREFPRLLRWGFDLGLGADPVLVLGLDLIVIVVMGS
jgi:hypothetical protein